MSHKELKDEQIIKQIQQGKHSQYEIIIRRYQDKLLRYITRFTLSTTDAEDILQEVFIKTYKNIQSFDTQKSFSSWIYRIAHNEAVNWLKKYKHENNVPILENDLDITSNEESFSDKLAKEEGLEKLEGCLDKIDPKYREVIILRYSEDKSYEEISDIIRKPTSTVGTWLKRGIEQLKKQCND